MSFSLTRRGYIGFALLFVLSALMHYASCQVADRGGIYSPLDIEASASKGAGATLSTTGGER